MTRRAFFSFHYENDIWRSCQVRNSWLTKPDRGSAGFWDGSLWEESKKKGDAALKRLIDDGLTGTSVTVILIGKESYNRKWIRYEIAKSFERGNGLLGVYIHNLKNEKGRTCKKGPNPFKYFLVDVHQWLSDSATLYEYNAKTEEWGLCKYVQTARASSYPYSFGLFGGQIQLSDIFKVYDYADDNGYNNLGKWIEESARAARKS